MKTTTTVKATAFVLLLAAAVRCTSVAQFRDDIHNQESPLAPKELSMVLLMPNLKAQLQSAGFKTSTISNKIHQNDVVTEVLKHHQEVGGDFKEAYVMTHNEQTKNDFKHLNVRMEAKKGLVLTGQKINDMSVGHRSAAQCVVRNKQLGVHITAQDGVFEIKSEGFQGKFEQKNELLKDFLMDLCKFAEVSKRQTRDAKRNLYLVEFKNLAKMLEDDKLAQFANSAITSLISLVSLKNLFGGVSGRVA